LDTDESVAVERLVNFGGAARQRIAHRQNRRRSVIKFQSGDQPVDNSAGTKGANRVVNQHGIGIDRLQPRADGVGALLAAFDQFANLHSVESSTRERLLPPADHDPNGFDSRMCGEGFDCPAQDGLATEFSVLLGQASTHAFAFSGGDDECGNCHGAGV
jgi:hypothetical protein